MAKSETTKPGATEAAEAGKDGCRDAMLESDHHANKLRQLPSWAKGPFTDFNRQIERLEQIVHLSRRGISMTLILPGAREIVYEADQQSDTPEARKGIEDAKEIATLAQREIDEDFPVLHAFAAVALWSALEALVRLCVARLLQHHKPAMELEVIRKLKVRIGDYERLEGEDRFFYILDRLEEEVAAPLRSGVTRFETILDPFGLSGAVDDDLKRNIFELGQVRNTLVHRSGVVDRRLAETCPWLGVQIGDRVSIGHEAFGRYYLSVVRYMAELFVRLGEHLGADVTAIRDRAKKLAVPEVGHAHLRRGDGYR